MGLAIGIVGLPNVGKSTLFNALTRAGALVANYPFATIDPNTGVVEVPDARLDQLTDVFKPQRKTPATVTFVDIAGLVKGASEGEGLGNQFLAHIREADAIAMVVRCFSDASVTHVEGDIDARRDIDTVDYELMLADLDAVRKRIERIQRAVEQKRIKDNGELGLLRRIEAALDQGTPARRLGLSADDKALVREVNLLTLKPVIYIANVDENDAARDSGPGIDEIKSVAAAEGSRWLPISARIESELQELGEEEAREFMQSIGLEESGLGRLARQAYEVLGLLTFFTAGEKECRAWTVTAGTRAPQAAGVIHTDFEKGFIKAEVADWLDLIREGGWNGARAKGLVRLEGKDYVFHDGDTTIFRFNV